MAGFAERICLPKSTAHFCFQLWDSDGTLDPYPRGALCRGPRGGWARGEPEVTRSSTPRAPRRPKRAHPVAPQGCRCGKKVTGRERHSLVDTLGLLLGRSVLPANIQDRDACPGDLLQERGGASFHPNVFSRTRAENGKDAAATGSWHLEMSSDLISTAVVVLAKAMDRQADIRLDQAAESAVWIRRLSNAMTRPSLRSSRLGHDPPHAQPLDPSQAFAPWKPSFLDRALTLTNLWAIHVVSL